jgi:tetratricopeptide (TPR) repeat protein
VVEQFETKFIHRDNGREKIFITVGEHEPEFIAITSDLAGRVSKDPLAQSLWNYRVLSQDNHTSTPHRTVYFGLEAIFQEFWHFDSETDGASLVEQFKVLSDRLGYEVVVPLSALVSLGSSALGSGRLDQAQSIFELLIKSYPGSEWGYVSLGSVHYNKGNKDRAKSYFHKALGINPDNPYTKDMLRSLDE